MPWGRKEDINHSQVCQGCRKGFQNGTMKVRNWSSSRCPNREGHILIFITIHRPSMNYIESSSSCLMMCWAPVQLSGKTFVSIAWEKETQLQIRFSYILGVCPATMGFLLGFHQQTKVEVDATDRELWHYYRRLGSRHIDWLLALLSSLLPAAGNMRNKYIFYFKRVVSRYMYYLWPEVETLAPKGWSQNPWRLLGFLFCNSFPFS